MKKQEIKTKSEPKNPKFGQPNLKVAEPNPRFETDKIKEEMVGSSETCRDHPNHGRIESLIGDMNQQLELLGANFFFLAEYLDPILTTSEESRVVSPPPLVAPEAASRLEESLISHTQAIIDLRTAIQQLNFKVRL